MGRLKWAIWVFVVISAIACGYRPLLGTGLQSRRIHVPMVENRTPFENIVAPLTSNIRHGLNANGIATAKTEESGDWVLRVTVQDIQRNTQMLSIVHEQETPKDEMWQIQASVQIIDAKGEVLSPLHSLVVRQVTPTMGDILAEEAIAERMRAKLLNEMAGRIVQYVLEY